MRRPKKGDHLTRLLFDGAVKGENRFDGWDLRPAPGTEPRMAQMVSVHESLHDQLNSSTAYGTLLHAVAWVARNRPDDPRFGRLLKGLLAHCRGVHESYATYLCLLSVGEGTPAIDLVESAPEYQAYFDQAAAIAQGVNGGYLRYHAVAATLRACMQVDVTSMALERGLESLRSSAFPESLRPDTLLRGVLQRISPDHWTRAVEQARLERPDLPGWDAILASESDPGAYHAAIAEEFDPTSTYLMERFHATVTANLPTAARGLSFNGHLPGVAPLIEAAERLLPAGPVRVPLRAAAPGDTPEQEIVASWKGETLVLREAPLPAERRRLPQVEEMAQMVTGTGSAAHLFIVARNASRLRAQHDWPAGAPAGDDVPITAVRRAIVQPDGTRHLEYYILDEPETLEKIVESLPNGLALLCNVSMAVYGDADWQKIWLPRLVGSNLLSVLVDLDPFEHFRMWSSQVGLSFRCAVMHLPTDHLPDRVFALQPDGAKALFLIPCSVSTGQAITLYLRELVPQPEMFREDASFLEALDKTAVGNLLGHLLREETFFDFTAGRMLRSTRL